MVPAHVDRGIAAQEIEIFPPLDVPEVLPARPCVTVVESDRLQDAGELGIDVIVMKIVVSDLVFAEKGLDVERSPASPPDARACRPDHFGSGC